MTRIGINPARGKISDYRPARISVTMLTYVPDLTGYFAQRLEVLQLALASLRAHTTLPHDLIVFDNGSCKTVTDALLQSERAGEIDYLILSEKNIGKIGALQILFHAAPGEIIAYSDDDILFYPGWLEASLEILENFPKVGMVSGLPVRNAARHARQSLDRLEHSPFPGLTVSKGRLIPDEIRDEWEIDWARSTGRDPAAHLAATKADLDLVLSLQRSQAHRISSAAPITAIGGANHFQFLSPKLVILQALPSQWSGKLMGHMVEMDEAVDAAGYLRLSTTKRFTRHLGNALSPEVIAEAQALSLPIHDTATMAALPGNNQRKRDANYKHWLLRIPGSRRILAGLYHKLFRIIYQ